MSWFAIHKRGQAPVWAGPTRRPCDLADGSILVEIDLARLREDDTPLLHSARMGRDPSVLTLNILSDGRLHLLHRNGAARLALSVGLDRDVSLGHLRVTFHWNSQTGRSLLTAENLRSGTIRQQAGRAAPAMPGATISALFGAEDDCHMHRALDWCAIRTGRHSVGAGACLSGDAPIDTPAGPRPARALRAGDMVTTADAGPQPLIWAGRVTVPALGSFRPIRLIAPYFGRRQDIVVQPHHRIACSSAEVEYLFDEDEVLTEAHHLANGSTAIYLDTGMTVTFTGLLLRDHHLLSVDGCRLESLFAGGIGRCPSIAATTPLASLAASGALPIHRKAVRRVLCGYEARSLAVARVQGRGPVAA
jgi:hypothetical protein